MYGFEEYVYLTPEEVLQKVTQEQILDWVLQETLGVPFNMSDRYISPFRTDNRPGCRFEQREDGAILFVDFGERHLSGNTHRSCFKMVQDAFSVDLQGAISLICSKFGLSTNTKDYTRVTPKDYGKPKFDNSASDIKYEKAPIQKRDKIFWSQFIITPEQLEEDNVFCAKKFSIRNRKGFRIIPVYGLCYAIDFIDKVKIYQPYSVDYRWITNCDENCIGNIDNLPSTGKELIIKKSYKDHRVVRNLLEGTNVIWFANEGAVPSMEILVNLVQRFEKITIFFDNDKAGIRAAVKLTDIFNSIRPNCAHWICLPCWMDKPIYKDPAKLVSKEGRRDSIIQLNQIGLYGKDT